LQNAIRWIVIEIKGNEPIKKQIDSRRYFQNKT